MILNNAPQAEAVLSNVGEIGEFRIRNSAKAFNILSSGLYANKVKAIIRELSCNAIDSHTAAGTKQPFEVHLPTTLEPWFSIRDFGTGLSHDQVTKIYTTYFESTKTESNDFIGALGLGSKSPFSYTDNFTVTAIQNGRKGIYTAFINDVGVPSIALMGEDQVTESNGVEVKFSVNDRYDFGKFANEAESVYRWFPVLPTITGNVITIEPPSYESKDIIPGVHANYESKRSIALMGNIAYPIDIPQKEQELEGLHSLLACGLIMEFGIGKLDFQASREGLSYIPLTIDSIRNKLKEVNSALTKVLATEANAITCQWKKSIFLYNKKRKPLWAAAVIDYVADTKFELFNLKDSWSTSHDLLAREKDMAAMNIQLKGFECVRHQKSLPNIKPRFSVIGDDDKPSSFYRIDVSENVVFIVNDGPVGAFERAKYHYRNNERNKSRQDIFVLNKIDKTKPMDLKAFYAMLHNPPQEQCKLVSTLDKKPSAGRSGMGKNVNIMVLERRGGSSRASNSNDWVWRDGGSLDKFGANHTYYYIPMSGFNAQFKTQHGWSVSQMKDILTATKLEEFKNTVFGVRKGDIDAIKAKKNWVNLEDHIVATLTGMNVKVGMLTVYSKLAKNKIFEYNSVKIIHGVNAKSPAKTLLDTFAGLPQTDTHWLNRLMVAFQIQHIVPVDDLVTKYQKVLAEFKERYPLLDRLDCHSKEEDVCHYVNLIDSVKGI